MSDIKLEKRVYAIPSNKKILIKNNTADINTKRKISIIFTRTKFFIKMLFISIFILGFLINKSSFAFFTSKEIGNFLARFGFQLNNIIIEGTYNIDLNLVLSNHSLIKNTPIINIDLFTLKAYIESFDWVSEAIIIRKLPDTLHIKIIEKIPIAIFQKNQKLYLIDQEGNVITDQNIDKFKQLIHTVGNGADIHAFQLVQSINANFIQFIVSAVRFGNRRWNLILDHDITLKMPEEGFDDAMNYVYLLQKQGKLFNSNVKVLDLRNKDRYYIEYK